MQFTKVNLGDAVENIPFRSPSSVPLHCIYRRHILKDSAILKGNNFHPEDYFLKNVQRGMIIQSLVGKTKGKMCKSVR